MSQIEHYHHEPAHALFVVFFPFCFAPRTGAPISPAQGAITRMGERTSIERKKETNREKERKREKFSAKIFLGEARLKPADQRIEGKRCHHSAIQSRQQSITQPCIVYSIARGWERETEDEEQRCECKEKGKEEGQTRTESDGNRKKQEEEKEIERKGREKRIEGERMTTESEQERKEREKTIERQRKK